MNLKRFVSVMNGWRDRFLSVEVGPSIDPRGLVSRRILRQTQTTGREQVTNGVALDMTH